MRELRGIADARHGFGGRLLVSAAAAAWAAPLYPPFGLDLFVASSTLRRPVETVIAGIWPFIATNVIVLALITYIPQISTAILKIIR